MELPSVPATAADPAATSTPGHGPTCESTAARAQLIPRQPDMPPPLYLTEVKQLILPVRRTPVPSPPAVPPCVLEADVQAPLPADHSKVLVAIWGEAAEPIDNVVLDNIMERLRAFCTIKLYFVSQNGWLWVEVATPAQAARCEKRLNNVTMCQGAFVARVKASAPSDWPPEMLPSCWSERVQRPEPLRRWQDPRTKTAGRKHRSNRDRSPRRRRAWPWQPRSDFPEPPDWLQ